MHIRHILRILRTLRLGVFQGLPMADQNRDPIDLFAEWYGTAVRSGLYLPDSMMLASCTPDGVPSARMVLLKGFDHSGFTFYTNYGSRKAQELDRNPNAAAVMHWNVLQRQIRIEGKASRVSVAESQSYFQTRPRGSQVAAWASLQSRALPERRALEEMYNARMVEFGEGDVPLPRFWGGYRLSPDSVEFWQGRANRMHDRLRFSRVEDGWTSEWLYP